MPNEAQGLIVGIATPPRLKLSRLIVLLAVGVVAASFLLLSPIEGATYPGTIPWSPWSILRRISDVLSLGGVFQTERGAEIKDVAFHLAAAFGVALLAVRLWQVPPRPLNPWKETWFHALILLGAWVALSALSAVWSGDAILSLKRAALYAVGVGWAAAVAGTVELPHLGRLMTGIGAVSMTAAGLTIWYFLERNPHHRPGFPIGNPSVLAANLLPALMLGLAWASGAVSAWRARRVAPPYRLLIGAVLVLGICGAAFALAGSRGALLGLVAGAATIVFFGLGRRGPLVASVVGIVIFVAAGMYFYSGRAGDTMARGATIRLRVYAWQYASEIWQTRPMLGAGAASFTRFGTQYGARDRFLDPAAFMGDWLEHAHNEFFEVFAEIGLFGGVTFVAAWVALLAAASRLLRSGQSAERRWLVIGITASIVAVLADGLFGIGLRLPGGAALFWTLVGTLLAACRCMSRPVGLENGAAAVTGGGQPVPRSVRRVAMVSGCGLASVILLVIGLFNFVGLVYERLAYRSYANADYGMTIEAAGMASDLLLTPTRVLFADELALRAHYARLADRVERLREIRPDASQPASGPASQPSSDAGQLVSNAAAAARSTYEGALRLERRAPMMPGAAAARARSAELLAILLADSDPRAAREWAGIAEATWLFHREQRRSDVETLLALTHYAKSLDEYVRNLRDALRAGFAPQEWHAALARIAQEPGLNESLGRMMAAAGPISPGTEPDTLVASFAPEAHRLQAAVLAARGEFRTAAAEAGEAVRLYEPIRSRFPTLLAVALYEQAQYLLRDGPQAAGEAAAHAERALAAVPDIQAQQRAAIAAPYFELLALCKIAAGDEAGALEQFVAAGGDPRDRAFLLADANVRLAELYVRYPPERRPDVRPWLDAALGHQPRQVRAWSWRAWLAADAGNAAEVQAVLDAAARAGVRPDVLKRIADGLRQEFPALGAVKAPGSWFAVAAASRCRGGEAHSA